MTFRYVTHALVPDHLRCGWLATPALEGTHHGFYSVLCVWLCGCRIPSIKTGHQHPVEIVESVPPLDGARK